MTTKKQTWLTEPNSGYHHNEIFQEDEELTHVGPGTPAGEWFRRFWLPVTLSSDLKDLPKAIRIRGEDLVVFRDGGGKTGLLELHCSHRGTSLEFGLIEKVGIRCCYHGWLYGVDGCILDTPGEPPDSTYKERLCHGAYPTHEFAGLVFAYMGPPDKKPEVPILDTYAAPFMRPDESEFPPLYTLPCNWLQTVDNLIDPVHTMFLHARSTGTQFTESFQEMPVFDWMETPVGVIYIASRRIGENIWVRVIEWFSPAMHHLANVWEQGDKEHPFSPAPKTAWNVPVDDTTTLVFSFMRAHEGPHPPPGAISVDPETMNGLRSYESRQRRPDDFEAMTSQQPINIHSLEHLTETDLGPAMIRKVVRQAVRAGREGKLEPKSARILNVKPGEVLKTYSGNTVYHIAPAPTLEEDRKLLWETGRRWAAEHGLV